MAGYLGAGVYLFGQPWRVATYPQITPISSPTPIPFMRVCGEAFPFIRREPNLTFFARHADVEHILGDRRFGRDTRHAPCGAARVAPQVYERIYPPQYPVWTRRIRESFLDLEPPRHTRIRRLVQWAFTRPLRSRCSSGG